MARENFARSHFEVEKTAENSARSHSEVENTRENSTRGHFEATWLDKARRELTSRPRGSPRTWRTLENLGNLCSRSPRIHFEATWLEKARLEATSKSPRNHLARESSTRGPFEATWLPRLAWLGLALLGSIRLRSVLLSSACLDPGGLTQLGLGRNCSKKLFKETIREKLSRHH